MRAGRRFPFLPTLPLTAQALPGEVEQYLTSQALLSSSMARNAFLEGWVAAGERDQSAMVGCLRNIQAEHGATTAFLCPIAPVAPTT